MRGYDGLIETEFRMIFLYLLVYDGFLYEFSPSEADDFSLMEIEFGQYSYEYHFKPQIDYDIINQAFVKHMVEYGSHFVLEIMPPSYFDKYLNKIENVVTNVDKDTLKRWGMDWPIVNLIKK